MGLPTLPLTDQQQKDILTVMWRWRFHGMKFKEACSLLRSIDAPEEVISELVLVQARFSQEFRKLVEMVDPTRYTDPERLREVQPSGDLACCVSIFLTLCCVIGLALLKAV